MKYRLENRTIDGSWPWGWFWLRWFDLLNFLGIEIVINGKGLIIKNFMFTPYNTWGTGSKLFAIGVMELQDGHEIERIESDGTVIYKNELKEKIDEIPSSH